MRALFSIAIFINAGLLFLIQPMVAKMILPVFGGAPAVWATSLVFFQTLLLLGYLYAHLGRNWSHRFQVGVHVGLFLLGLASLPISARLVSEAQITTNPAFALLLTLGMSVGIPFFLVAAGSPMLQVWFSRTDDPAAKDPYFLYRASNFGSMVGLFAYPFLLEPNATLKEQATYWAFGYGLLIAVLGVSGFLVLKNFAVAEAPSEENLVPEAAPTWQRRLLWLALAAVPTSLLSSSTGYLTTNIAPIPLLWIVPLALYLLTFIVGFKTQKFSSAVLGRFTAIGIVALALILILEASTPLETLALIHLAIFFLCAWTCHARLYEERPSSARLTEFYAFVALGGVIGGGFNALLAPLIFNNLYEYPIGLALAAMLIRPKKLNLKWEAPDFLLPAALGGIALVAILTATQLGYGPSQQRTLITVGIPLIISFTFVDRPWRYGLALLAIFAVTFSLSITTTGKVIYLERSFFGVHRVSEYTYTLPNKQVRTVRNLVHGNTLHGRQNSDEPTKPLTYYYPSGPVGQVVRSVLEKSPKREFAFVGMGTGSLAAYGEPGSTFTFYEIDQSVIHISRDLALFTFLRDSKADLKYVLGDARLTLTKSLNEYDLIVLDAFSSDAIPTHLLTVEAIEGYFSRLKSDGILVIHISNRYLDLSGPIAANMKALGLFGLIQHDDATTDESLEGKTASHYVLLSRDKANFNVLKKKSFWEELVAGDTRPWTDDYSNVLSAWEK